jgi:hypothetical protein
MSSDMIELVNLKRELVQLLGKLKQSSVGMAKSLAELDERGVDLSGIFEPAILETLRQNPEQTPDKKTLLGVLAEMCVD